MLAYRGRGGGIHERGGEDTRGTCLRVFGLVGEGKQSPTRLQDPMGRRIIITFMIFYMIFRCLKLYFN